jgi:hypothetical protein
MRREQSALHYYCVFDGQADYLSFNFSKLSVQGYTVQFGLYHDVRVASEIIWLARIKTFNLISLK